MFATLGKVAVGAVKGKAKRIATDKLLNRKKKTDVRREKVQEAMNIGSEKSGDNIKAPSSALANIPLADSVTAITKSSGGGSDDTVVGVALRIKTTVIEVEKLLAGSVALQKKQLQAQKDAQEDSDFKKEEADLEKKKPKETKSKFNFTVPGQGLLSTLINFISNIALGFIVTRLVDIMPKLMPVLKILGGLADFILKSAGFILNGLITFVDWAYKFVEMGRGLVKNLFGEEGAKKFDTFMSSLKDLISGFLIWKIIGEKIFKAIIRTVTRAFRIARIIVKKAFRFAKKLISNIGKQILKIPGIKNVVGKIGQIGGSILSKGASVGGNILSKAGGIASKGAGAVTSKVGGFAAKIFGKAANVVAPALKAATPAVKGFAKRIPILGPIIVAVVSLMSGEPIGQALFKAVGAGLGGALGTFIPIPVLGTLIGETIGVYVGNLMYDLILGGGPEAAGQRLKQDFERLLSGGMKVFDWIKDGFGRLMEGLPKNPFKLGGFILNPLNISDKVKLIGKAFFTRDAMKPEKKDKKDNDKDKKDKKTTTIERNKEGYLSMLSSGKRDKVEQALYEMRIKAGSGRDGYDYVDNPKYKKDVDLIMEHGLDKVEIDGGKVKLQNNILARNNNVKDGINDISQYASYEESGSENEVILAPSSASIEMNNNNSNVVKEKIVNVSMDTSDPYEVLYKG